MMRTNPEDRASMDLMSELAETKNKSEAVRLAIRFAILNPITFKYWLHEK